MLKRCLILVALAGLGCAGLTEKAVEITTGGQMEISENGDVTMTLADGTTVVTQQGADLPEGFPMPPPYEGAEPQALVTTTDPEGKTYWVVTYEMNAPRAQVAETYEAWLNEHTTDVQHKKESVAGMVSEVLTGSLDGDAKVVVTLTEAFGANSISAVWSPEGAKMIE